MASMSSLSSISYELASGLFYYSPEDGTFTTLKQTSFLYPVGESRPVVMKKESSKAAPHPAIKMNGFYRRATHLAYLLHEGEHLPEGMGIFFEDGDQNNLRWSNLKVVDLRCGGKF